MARRSILNTGAEKQLPSITNRGYFSDYFLAYRLDVGLADLYKRWDEAEKVGEPTAPHAGAESVDRLRQAPSRRRQHRS